MKQCKSSSKSLKPFVLSLSVLSVALLACSVTATDAAGKPDGGKIFKQNCAGCHPGGGNIVDAKKPLKGAPQLSSQDAFKKYLLKPSGPMQAFPKIANDSASLEALYKYCKSLK